MVDKDFINEIKNFIDQDEFASLQQTMESGQIDELKNVLKESFDDNKNLIEISEEIQKRVKPEELKGMSPEARSQTIARTETTRTAANGSINHYATGGIEQARFVATISDRTCPICEGLNGQIVGLQEAKNVIPVHVGCRCTWVPVTG